MKIRHFMALVVLSLATVPGARAAVLAGPITNAANAHAYYLLSSNTWTASEAEAVGLGGHLVTINDAAENQWVLNTFFPLTGVPYASLWIGLNEAASTLSSVVARREARLARAESAHLQLRALPFRFLIFSKHESAIRRAKFLPTPERHERTNWRLQSPAERRLRS